MTFPGGHDQTHGNFQTSHFWKRREGTAKSVGRFNISCAKERWFSRVLEKPLLGIKERFIGGSAYPRNYWKGWWLRYLYLEWWIYYDLNYTNLIPIWGFAIYDWSWKWPSPAMSSTCSISDGKLWLVRLVCMTVEPRKLERNQNSDRRERHGHGSHAGVLLLLKVGLSRRWEIKSRENSFYPPPKCQKLN